MQSDAPTPRHAARVARSRRRRRRWAWSLGVGVPVAVLLGGVAWLGLDALTARTELLAAGGLVGDLEVAVVDGDRAAAATTLAALQDHAERAAAATDGPHWSAAAALPWVGPDVAAVRTAAEVVDGLARRALPGLLDATDLVDPTTLAPVDGRVDLAPLVEAAPVVIAADAEVQAAGARLAEVDLDALWPMVAAPLTELTEQVREVSMTTATAARAVGLLPPMLGADGSREYLLLVQNSAEPRATGGIPGAVVLLRAEDGRVEVVEQRSGGPLVDLPAPVLPLSPAEERLFGGDLAADIRDVTFTPDFPRSGEIARALWAQQIGGEVDGVVSVDPGALALMLGAIGPVPLAPGPVATAVGGALTADNAVQALLSTVYLTVESPAEQDAFFAETAATVFGALVGGQGEASRSVDALAEAARQGRLMVWSAHPEEQALLEGTVLDGALRGSRAGHAVVGLYLNDANADKMGWYLGTEASVERLACRADGSQTLRLTVRLTNGAPADAASLPRYVTGPEGDIPAGDTRMNVLVYASTGGYVEDVEVVGAEPGVTSQVHDGLSVVGRTVQLSPGQSQVILYTLVTGIENSPDVELRTTPHGDLVTHVTRLSPCER